MSQDLTIELSTHRGAGLKMCSASTQNRIRMQFAELHTRLDDLPKSVKDIMVVWCVELRPIEAWEHGFNTLDFDMF